MPHWNLNGRPGSNPNRMGFARAGVAMTRSKPIYTVCRGRGAKRVWALDADLAAAFDKIDHSRLLGSLGSFPARDLIRDWLKAGVFEAGKGFAPTDEGTPQGGVISPLLLNIAMHGLEEAAGVRYINSGRHAGQTKAGGRRTSRPGTRRRAGSRARRSGGPARWRAPAPGPPRLRGRYHTRDIVEQFRRRLPRCAPSSRSCWPCSIAGKTARSARNAWRGRHPRDDRSTP